MVSIRFKVFNIVQWQYRYLNFEAWITQSPSNIKMYSQNTKFKVHWVVIVIAQCAIDSALVLGPTELEGFVNGV
jgi:hypothetical protein